MVDSAMTLTMTTTTTCSMTFPSPPRRPRADYPLLTLHHQELHQEHNLLYPTLGSLLSFLNDPSRPPPHCHPVGEPESLHWNVFVKSSTLFQQVELPIILILPLHAARSATLEPTFWS